jgi:FRG domain
MTVDNSLTEVISSVLELLQYVQEHCRAGKHLYRGQPFGKPLLPRIARYSMVTPQNVLEIEKRLIQQFTRRSRPHLELEPKSNWDRLAIAQHYGMATRLLDWSENPLAAMWFALQKPRFKDHHEDGAVWVLQVHETDYAASENGEPWECESTRVFQPVHITKTIAAQNGWFTLHKYLDEHGEFIPLDKNKNYRERLTQLSIPRTRFASLNRQLDRCGINAASLFPDVRGLCEYLDWKELHNSE